MKSVVLVALVLSSVSAFAQENSPAVLGLQAKLMQEVNSNLQCLTQTVVEQQQSAKLAAELKALKEKYEPDDKDRAR